MKRVYKNRILELKDGIYYLQENKEVPLDDICNKCALLDLCDNIADNLNRIDYFACHDLIENGKKWCHLHPHSYFIKLENENSI